MSTTQDLAETILGLTHSELKQVATALNNMCIGDEPGTGGRGVPISAQDFLDLLHDWAEAQ